eukprot:1160740-Pelagomonas_calceolata.AAC.4
MERAFLQVGKECNSQIVANTGKLEMCKQAYWNLRTICDAHQEPSMSGRAFMLWVPETLRLCIAVVPTANA